MFRITISALILLLLPQPVESSCSEWGFYAHRRINHFAVFTLPPGLFGFYKQHVDYVSENAVNPDKRRYAVKGEAPRHFIDIDHYAAPGENPFDLVPRKWKDAVAKYSEDTLQAYGIIPWHIDVMVHWLTRAFQDQDIPRILRLSADLGHYIGDAHVPLHTTKNYNGQLTNQYGIHGFWESRIPEIYDQDYDFFTGRAKYIDYVQDYVWEIVEESHWAVDSVLSIEKELSQTFPKDQQFAFEDRGRSLMKVYSKEYTDEYHRRLNGMVERRMRQTVAAVGNLWYTAWVNAGQPDLTGEMVDMDEIRQRELEEIDQKLKSKEELKVREHDN